MVRHAGTGMAASTAAASENKSFARHALVSTTATVASVGTNARLHGTADRGFAAAQLSCRICVRGCLTAGMLHLGVLACDCGRAARCAGPDVCIAASCCSCMLLHT